MSNKEVIEKFFLSYQNHDHQGMQDCLAPTAQFSDYAFKKIKDNEVKAMWHWFCILYKGRPPIDVPEFEILESENDTVIARYRVVYLYGEKKSPVDYFIKTRFKLHQDKITEQNDIFDSVSENDFAKMALGEPLSLLASTPFLRPIVRIIAKRKLNKFMDEFGYKVG